jgi:glycerophosphoryl diester phosphodiesterase
MQKIAPDLRCAALYEGTPRSFVEISKEAGRTPIVCPHYSLVTPERVAEAHAAHIKVIAWTANTPSDWDDLIAAKVDAIITDDPAALLDHLAC